MTVLELTVTEVRDLCPDVIELDLGRPDGAALPEWAAGAHIDLDVGGHVRQYSLCGDPERRPVWTVAILRDRGSRGGSVWLHEQAQAGLVLGASAPRNHFALVESDHYLFLAGGIGVTPFDSLVPAAHATGAQVRVALGGSDALLAEFRQRFAAYAEVLTVPATEGLLPVDDLVAAAAAGTAVYCCGPAGMVAAVRRAVAERTDLSLCVEQFEPAGAVTGDDRPVVVELATSGLVVDVPADQSILDAVSARGVFVASSCREGTCGTCEVVVLDGMPEHRDTVIDPDDPERDASMMICVSRARSDRLVLDL